MNSKKVFAILISVAIIFSGFPLDAISAASLLAPPSSIDPSMFSVSQRKYSYPAGNFDITVRNPNNNYAKTSAGVVSVGMSMMMRLLYPDTQDYPGIIIAPRASWIGKDGTNLMQIYFSIACNYFIHKRNGIDNPKTKIVCRPDQKDRIIKYLRLGNPYDLPNPDGYLSDDLIRRFRREAIYLADRASIDGKTRMVDPYPDMIEFEFFSETGEAIVDNVTIKDKEDGTFAIIDGEQEQVVSGKDNVEIDLEFSGQSSLSEIPEFGVTFLGTSGGMDPNGLTSNQIIWAGDRHFLVDVGAPTLPALKALGLSPKDITDVVITHMHEDHIVGLLAYLEWCKTHNHKIRLLIEPGIYEHVKNQLKQVLDADLDAVYNIEYIPLKFYQRLSLGEGDKKVVIEAIPAFHGTPTTMLQVTYKREVINHSSDHTFDPVRFKQILSKQIQPHIAEDLRRLADMDPDKEQVFDDERADELWHRNRLLVSPRADLPHVPSIIIHEAGNSAPADKNVSNHTSPFTLHEWVRRDKQHAMWINHTARLPEGEFIIKVAKPLSTITLIKGDVTRPETYSDVDPASTSL